jgi:hypothetical protein
VSLDDPLLDRAAIEDAFCRLGERLARRGVVGDLYVFGGAAMALAYDARRATRDIDAVFQPHGVVLDEARAVAGELGLPSGGSTSRPVSMSRRAVTLLPLGCSTTLGCGCRPHPRSICWR